MTKRTEDAASGDVATFHHSLCPEGPHRVRTIVVERRVRKPVTRRLRAGCDAAERARHYALRDWSIGRTFDVVAPAASIQIAWLEYLDEAGQWEVAVPDVDMGTQFGELERGMDLLRQIGTVIERWRGHANREPSDDTFADPSQVLHALRNARSFYEIERHEIDHLGYWIDAVPELAEHVA